MTLMIMMGMGMAVMMTVTMAIIMSTPLMTVTFAGKNDYVLLVLTFASSYADTCLLRISCYHNVGDCRNNARAQHVPARPRFRIFSHRLF
jgi:hypothetical protein